MGKRQRWVRHLVGVCLGIALILALGAFAYLDRWLTTQAPPLDVSRATDPLFWPAQVRIVGLCLVGAILTAVVLAARRLPWLPTVAAAVLVYGLASNRFLSPVGHWLPPLGPGSIMSLVGRLVGGLPPSWDLTLTTLFAGATTAAAIWGWWHHWRDKRTTEPTVAVDGQ